METKLLPCPFCGGEAQIIESRFGEKGAFVGCIRCLATAKRYSTKAEAIEAWNRRANDADN